MIESYKYKSKIATAISFIAMFIMYVGKDEIAKLLPPEYAFLAGIIVTLATYIATQKTEDKRAHVAQQMVHEEYQTDNETPVEEDANDDI
nr:hypothetical protein [uncultured Methanobrevibacter sp.]